jgi:hypothetical protein
MSSQQLVPLTEFMERASKSGRPMELCGYDCQLTGSASYADLMKDIANLANRSSPPALDRAGLAALASYVTALLSPKAPEGSAREDGEAAIAAFVKALDEPHFAAVLTLRERDFWKHFFKSLRGLCAHRTQIGNQGLTMAEQFNGRDDQGGDTLAWLARERIPIARSSYGPPACNAFGNPNASIR